MAPLPDYVTGTITLTNGSPNFTGDGTGWLAAGFREGDTILGVEDNEGVVYVIESITDNDAGTLTQDWQGATGTYTYRMRYLSDGQRVTAQARQLIELLGNGNLQAVAGLPGTPQTLMMFTGPGAMIEVPRTDLISGASYDVQVDTLSDRDAYDSADAGFAVLVADVGDGRAAIYSKVSNASGDWSDPAYVTGPVGPSPVVTVGSTTTGDPGTDADVSATPTVDGVELEFTIPAGEGFSSEGDYSGATAYVKGDVVLDQGSSWVAKQATTGNAPPTLPTTSNTYWQLIARAGTDGAGTVSSVTAGRGIAVNSSNPASPAVSLSVYGQTAKGANYTLVAGDFGWIVLGNSASAITFSLTAAATLGGGWWFVAKNISTGDLTIDPDGSETIDGETTLVLKTGQSALIVCNGSGFRSFFNGGGGTSDPWAAQPIGVPIPLQSNITGVTAPPTDQDYRYIKLTASDSYNTGVLTSESVSGSAPLVIATAVIDLSDSPLDGQTVQLINTERRALRAGSAGTVQNDQMQQITGDAGGSGPLIALSTVTNSGAISLDTTGATTTLTLSGTTVPRANIGFDSADSPDARAGNETRSKNIGVDYYMRIL